MFHNRRLHSSCSPSIDGVEDVSNTFEKFSKKTGVSVRQNCAFARTQYMCTEWAKEPTSYELNVVLRLSLPSNDLAVYQLSCIMFTENKNRRLTWGDIKPYLDGALTIEF